MASQQVTGRKREVTEREAGDRKGEVAERWDISLAQMGQWSSLLTFVRKRLVSKSARTSGRICQRNTYQQWPTPRKHCAFAVVTGCDSTTSLDLLRMTVKNEPCFAGIPCIPDTCVVAGILAVSGNSAAISTSDVIDATSFPVVAKCRLHSCRVKCRCGAANSAQKEY